MTTHGYRAGVRSELVHANRPPDPGDGPVVDVRPGTATVCDGRGFHTAIHVICPDEDRHYDSDHVNDIVAGVGASLRTSGADLVRFGNRSWLGDVWPPRTLRTVERRLIATARREGATLLTWTSDSPHPGDRVVYDAIIDR